MAIATNWILFCPVVTAAREKVDLTEITRQARDLERQGKLKDAIDMESQIAKKMPKEWLPHSAMAYLFFRGNHVYEAWQEAKQAASLAPRRFFYLTNLAQMEYETGHYRDSAQAFQRCRELQPSDWSFGIGLALSYMAIRRRDEGLAVLSDMTEQKGRPFNWYYQVAATCLYLGEHKMAEESARKAMQQVDKPEQGSLCRDQLFLLLMLDNQVESAKSMIPEVFYNNKSVSPETYVRAASTLIAITDPAQGKRLLDAAVTALTDKPDSDTFYRLGRIFEDKAELISCSATKYGAWLDCARQAYNQAIVLNPGDVRCHIAIAAILGMTGNEAIMREELRKSSALEADNHLVSYLISKFDHKLNLTKVDFAMNRLCACKLREFNQLISSSKGVAFETIVTKRNPFQATVLIDQTQTPVKVLFEVINKFSCLLVWSARRFPQDQSAARGMLFKSCNSFRTAISSFSKGKLVIYPLNGPLNEEAKSRTVQ